MSTNKRVSCTYTFCKLELLSKRILNRFENSHLSRYHSDRPVIITCKVSGEKISIRRDPASNMFYRCICNTKLIARGSVRRHFNACGKAQSYVENLSPKDDTVSETSPPSTTTSLPPTKKIKKNPDLSEQGTLSSQQQSGSVSDVFTDRVARNTTTISSPPTKKRKKTPGLSEQGTLSSHQQSGSVSDVFTDRVARNIATISSPQSKKGKKKQGLSEQSTLSSQQQSGSVSDVIKDRVATNSTEYVTLQYKVEVQEAIITDLRRRLERLEKDHW